ncbi:MAG: VWA domain-containing protein [Lachnospiraceae bacterium]|nr:VWA domain-containing protein [Lachnospiraceae bacterium]
MTKILTIKSNKVKRIFSMLLIIMMIFTSIHLEGFNFEVKAAQMNTTIYLIDSTSNNWLGNDNAVIELVDNTNGHIHYTMSKVDNETWSVSVPETAYNITFNRLNPDDNSQWNSWSAGGRDSNNTYYVDGSEYGHWNYVEVTEEENYFHAGDIVYLDVSEFTAWKNDNAFMYINFTAASREENNGQDINLSNANETKYKPKLVNIEVQENVYAYVIGFEDEGATDLRFWRGDRNTLWNCSVVLNYEDYANGLNCIKINSWDNIGVISVTEYDMDTEVDSDGDGLPDYYEAIYGLNKYNADSDNDGLTDSQEIYFTKTNPLKYDSVTEGISDADIDNDKDGLNNGREVALGTNPNDADSDEDGLSDGDEVNVYLTDPCNADTDGDTLKDGDEIELNFSPLLVDTDYNGIWDCDERIFQNLEVNIGNQERNEVSSVSVEFECTGYINSTTSIEDLYGKDIYVSDTVGLVGVPIDINSTSAFDSAVIKFYMDSSCTLEILDNLLILWYDEENDRFVEQETSINEADMSVSTEVTHFSKYMIVDKVEWFEAWRDEIDYIDDSERVYDTVIALDCSGSMSTNDPNFVYTVRNTLYPGSSYQETTCYRKLASKNYVKAQKRDDQTGIVLFASTASVACGLTNSEYDLITAIDRIYSSGGTNFNNAVNTSVNMLTNSRADSEKMILLVSDGESIINSTTLNAAISNDIKINTVYIGGQNNNELLRSIAEQTGGQYFKAVTADELIDIYSEIIVDQRIDSTDSDGDGIPDIFEITGMKLSNGTVIYTDPFNPDTDNDGLLDGEEIIAIPTYWLNTIFNEYNVPIQISAYIFKMHSNPNMKDTDGDGLLDGKEITLNNTENKIAPKDPNPMYVNGPAGLWKEHISQLESGDRVAHYLEHWYNYDPNISWKIWEWNWSEIATGVGSKLLMFKSDEKNIAVHSQVKTWQSIGGYNDLYDDIFHIGTFGNMDKEKFEFNYDGEDYVIWTWRGDYLNLGSGAEIGIYTDPDEIGIPNTLLKIEQWDVDENCALKMNLYLYNYYNINNIDNIFCWEPNEPQWWITGFNPDFDNPNKNDMISIGVIDFEEKTGMYEALKSSVSQELSKYLIFDEDGHTVWMMWGKY